MDNTACDCRYDDTLDRIEYCSMHGAARDLLHSLKRILDNPNITLGGDMRIEALVAVRKAEGENR